MYVKGSDFSSSSIVTVTSKNYVVFAKADEVYYLGETQFHYLTNDPHAVTDSTYKTWAAAVLRMPA